MGILIYSDPPWVEDGRSTDPPLKNGRWAAQEFLLCRVGAGRSYLVDKAAQAETQLQQGLCQVPGGNHQPVEAEIDSDNLMDDNLLLEFDAVIYDKLLEIYDTVSYCNLIFVAGMLPPG